MVRFEITDETIELAEYSPDTTLPQLSAKLEEFRKTNLLKTKDCKGCGFCCQDNIPVLGFDLPLLMKGLNCSLEELKSKYLIIPEKPNIKERRKSIKEMCRNDGIPESEAVLLYEYNTSEPLIMNKQETGDCCLLKDKLCSLYTYRPYSCGLYLCNMGEKLEFIQEMIVREGTWHAYSLLGWISKEDISHNPFLKAENYDQLLVKDFDYQLQDTLDKLFFYF
jgi:hypothetical protein